jgi:hypothetical protein
MNSGMTPLSARATIPTIKAGASGRQPLATLSKIKFFPVRSGGEHDFAFLVFGSIGAPNLAALILLKAKSTPARHRLSCTEGTQAGISRFHAIYRDLRGPRAGANNHERCLLDVMS